MNEPIKIPTIDEDSHHAPPWKVDAPFPNPELGVWGVTTDRGDPRDEYDVFEDPPEWAVRLAVLAPTLYLAVVRVVTQRLDDICWRDAYTDLATLVGVEFTPDLLPRDAFLANCARFQDSLASGACYVAPVITEEETAELRAENAALRVEIGRLTKLLTEPELVKLELEPGGSLRMALMPCLGAKALAASFADMIGDAANWRSVEVGPMPTDQGMLIVTVRRVEGKTPEEMVGELTAEIDRLKQLLESTP